MSGAFSTVTRTNLTTGQPYPVNAALANDCNLDSDSDGIVNCNDPDPLPHAFSAAELALTVTVTNTPQPKALISWNTAPSTTNFVYYKTTMTATNWQLLTNFTLGQVSGRVSVIDPLNTSGRLYRVRVDTPHP